MTDPWLPLPLSLAALLVTHFIVTQSLLTLILRVTHSQPMALLLYAVLIWPGTVLHEWAHWLAARLLGLRANLPHLLPSLPSAQGRIVLGHVVVERGDILRRALVGAAPFVAGTLVVALVARAVFALPLPALGDDPSLRGLIEALPALAALPNIWLWLYLLFAVTNGMLPSPSDREAWPSLLVACAGILLLLALTVGLPSPPAALTEAARHLAALLTLVFVLTSLLNLLLALPLFLIERLLWVIGR